MMNRLICICCGVVILTHGVFGSSAYADNGAGAPRHYGVVELEPIIVTARRSRVREGSVAEDAVVYTQEDIRQTSARDLGEVLSYVPGVDVQLNGQFGQSTALSINGSSARQVLLMIDGIPFNTQINGQANPTQIPVEHIDRIEIIKGASSSTWGSSLGGVINVITKDVGDSLRPAGRLTSSFAEFSTTKNSLELAGKIAELGYFAAGSFLNTDGAQAITDAEEKKVFSKLSYPLGDAARLAGSFGYNEAETRYALASSSTISSQPYFTRYGQILVDVDKDDYDLGLAFKYNHQDIITDTITIATGAMNSVSYSNVYKGISLNGSKDMSDYGLLVMGADFDWHTFKSSRYLGAAKSIKMQAPYVNHTFEWNNWEWTTGVRYDHNDQFGSQTSPSFGAVYHFHDNRQTAVRAKISRGFNAPPLMWIFNDDGVFVGPNPDLKAERSLVYEAGLKTNPFPAVEMDLNLYRADVKDAIKLNTSSLPYVQENLRKVRRQGVEVLLNYKVTNDLAFYGSGAFNDVENRETKKTLRDQGIARHKFTFGADYKNKNGFGLHLSGYYNRWSSPPSAQANDRKPVFDIKMTQEFEDVKDGIDVETFLKIHNITNSKYWSSISFPLPKRYFEGGFSVKF